MATAEDMTISRYGRGTCPVCDRPISLTKAGRVRNHGDKKHFPPVACAGSWQKPKED